jgi:hypothetical protein
MSNFDFVPNNNYLSPSYGQPMESSINQSEFLRSMWDMPASQPQRDLQPLTLTPPNECGLLPAHTIISPSSAVISPSSSISSALTSPESSPYTPSTGTSHNFVLPGDIHSSPESDDLQLEMQMQNDFASFSWQTAGNMWNNADGLLGDDFELGAIPPIEIGMQQQKYNQDMVGDSLEFGRDFVQALEGTHFNEGGILSFDDMMAGQGF